MIKRFRICFSKKKKEEEILSLILIASLLQLGSVVLKKERDKHLIVIKIEIYDRIYIKFNLFLFPILLCLCLK